MWIKFLGKVWTENNKLNKTKKRLYPENANFNKQIFPYTLATINC